MTLALDIPDLLDFPDKLLPLITEFNKYKYFLIDGGRVSAKSQSVGRLLLDVGEKNKSKNLDHMSSGSSIIFKGFREQGKLNIKGLEGVDILWIDEAQGITKPTLQVIIPTIRKS